jgi:hypothetical protein
MTYPLIATYLNSFVQPKHLHSTYLAATTPVQIFALIFNSLEAPDENSNCFKNAFRPVSVETH